MRAAGAGDTRLVALVCAAQVLVQIGAFFWPALLPDMMRLWSLSNSEAGWITAAFYAAYMVSVPVLVMHTPQVPLTRAAASAMLHAPASPRADTKRKCPRWWIASKIGMLWIEITP